MGLVPEDRNQWPEVTWTCDHDDLTQTLHDQMPLTARLGITARSLGPDGVELALDWAPELATATGTATIESKTNFFRTVIAKSIPIHVGSTTIVIETELTAGELLVAKVTQTQAVLRPRHS